MVKLERPPEKSNPDAVPSDRKIRELAELGFESDDSLLDRWLEFAEKALQKNSQKSSKRPD
jgi:hypothetical protein